jgi:putative heme-binding domain-containing protein
MITNDFRGHRVCRFVVTPDGAGYASREKPELIKTNHGAFRPIDVKMGPDGAIYIADWYNPIIQHGEVDFRDPRRDHVHGRIWRVTAKGRPLVPRPKLVNATTEELLEALKAPEDWTRHFAKRVLKERGKEKVLPALAAWVKKLNPADADYEHHLLEALWTYESLDVVEPKLLSTLLHARDHRARAAAVRVADQWRDRLDDALGLFAERVGDEHPQVRLEAVRAIAHRPGVIAHLVALHALDLPMDKFLDYALWLTIRELAPTWLPEFEKGRVEFDNPRHLLFALEAVNSPAAVKPLIALIQQGKVPADREEQALTLIGSLGSPKELSQILDLALETKTPVGRRARLLAALEQAARQRHVQPEGDLGRIGPVLNEESDALRSAAARLTGGWKLETLRGRLVDLAHSPKSSEPVRQAAFEGLAALGGPASRQAIETLIAKGQSAIVRQQAVIALVGLDVTAAARHAAVVLAEPEASEAATNILQAFVQRKNGLAALAAALKDQKLPADVAKVGVRLVRGSTKDAGALVDALTKAGGLTTGPRVLSPEEMKQMMADVAQHGNPVRGEAIYRRKDQVCQKCHAIAGAGGQVGPDLSSIGASAQVDYLIESILQPNKAIKENYHSLNIGTRDGRLISGIPVRQTEKELVLRDAEDREVSIPLKDIDVKEQGGSLMPEGLADTLTRSELVDLVRFLSELGKVGPYSPSKARLVRRWQALTPSRESYTLLIRTSHASAAGDDPALVWTPAYSTVAGVLPLEDLPRFQFGKNGPTTAFIRCQLEATTPGKVKLLLNSSQGINAWLNREPVDARDSLELDLKQGLHTITLAIDLQRRKDPLRIELDDVPGSSARVRILGGK